MNKITCDMARDLMPLVVDDIASEDSRAAVHAHMEDCSDCTRVFAAMQTKEPEPTENDTSFIKFCRRLEGQFRLRNIVIALFLVLFLASAGFFGYWWVDGNIHGMGTISPTDCATAQLSIDTEDLQYSFAKPEGATGLMHITVTPNGPEGLWDYQMDFGDDMTLRGWGRNWDEDESDILYFTPIEPNWLFDRTGSMDVRELSFSQFYWINDELHFIRHEYIKTIENGETIWVEDPDRIKSDIPVREVRWGNPDDYVTLYTLGDTLPLLAE